MLRLFALPKGLVEILGATVIAGVAGYVVTWLVYRQVGAANYAIFAVFWAALYLVIGGISGIQQEVTRATRPASSETRARSNQARNFGVVAALCIFIFTIATAPIWAEQVFPELGWALVWPLAVGAGSYVLVATLGGTLYGLSKWRPLALMMVADGSIRLILLAVVLTMTRDTVMLAWAVALPFPLVVIGMWPFIRRTLARATMDVGNASLGWNVSRTVLASVSSAVLISGFPLLLGVTAKSESPALVGELIFTITLTRAPLIITAMSLQSYFVVRFREQSSWWKPFFRVQGIIAMSGVAIAFLSWYLGPALFTWISGRAVSLDGPLLAVLATSSALVAALCVSAPAVLARSQHRAYSLGWVVAAIVTIGLMMLPIGFLPRVSLALLIGPIAGLLIHVLALYLAQRRNSLSHSR